MDSASRSRLRRDRRHRRVRARVSGTAARPRLAVFRSVKHVAAQLIDDVAGKTLLAVHEGELSDAQRKGTKTERAKALGSLLAKKATAKGVTAVVFDRGASRYHGRVAAFAEAARAGGLTF